MRHIGVTGPRRLTDAQRKWLVEHMVRADLGDHLHVGDASGVDALARCLNGHAHLRLYRVEGPQPWQVQARSKRMVEGLRDNCGTLWAYPNKPEPVGITRDRWQGSGTWGTIRYAQGRGVKTVIVPLPSPEWDHQPQQLTLW